MLRLKCLGQGSYRAHPGVPPGNRPLLQLPLVVAAVQQIHLGIAETGQEPGEESGVDVPRLSGTVDHHRFVEAQSEPGEQLAIGSSGQQLSGNSPVTGPQRLGVQVHRLGEVALQVGEYIAAYIHHVDPAASLPPGQLVGRYQLWKPLPCLG